MRRWFAFLSTPPARGSRWEGLFWAQVNLRALRSGKFGN